MAWLRVLTRRSFMAALCFLSLGAGAGNPPEVDRGLSWLASQVTANGSLASESSSVATPLQARSEAVTTLRLLSSVPAALSGAVANEPATPNEYLARQAIALAPLGIDVSIEIAALVAGQNADGGFGASAGYASNPLDTAYVLLALKAASPGSATPIGKAIAWMQSAQGADGSFGINEQPSVYVTSMGLLAFNAFAQTYPVSQSAQSARNALVALQSAGAYGSVLNNAVATLAISGATLDASLFSSAQAALKASQSSDGSWSQDPYLTAISIRAIAASASAPPPATTGQVTATVVDQSTSQPIAGVAVSVTGAGSASANTDASGAVALAGLAPGSYTVQFTKAGYSTVSLSATVSAGVITNLGTVRLQAATTTASLQGIVRDGATGQPLGGATISAGAASASSAADGSYQLTGLVPGTATVSAAKSAYQTASISLTLPAGVVISFSPSLYAPGQSPSTASLHLKVVDHGTGQSIAGATVSTSGATATSSSTGDVSISGLSAGAVTLQASATGYASSSLQAAVSVGNNELGTLALDRSTSSLTVSGKITDSATSLPIGGATVSVTGTSLTTNTDSNGNYAISGITQAQFSLQVSAPGYLSKSIAVSLAAIADTVANAALDRAPSTGLAIDKVTTDKPAYDPFTNVELSVTVRNLFQNPASFVFQASIVDARGGVILTTPGVLANIVPGAPAEVDFDTHLKNQAAGNYSVLVQAFDPQEGTLLAQGTASFAINPLSRIGGGITLSPPITQAGVNTPIRMTANVSNLGNLPLAAGPLQLTATLTTADTSIPPHATFDIVGGVTGTPVNFPVGGGYDAQGNFYSVNSNDLRVLQRTPDGQVSVYAQIPSVVAQSFVQPTDLVATAAGEIYVLNRFNNVLRVTPSGTTVAATTNMPLQFAFDRDPQGNFDILHQSGNRYELVHVPASGGAPVTTLLAGLASPRQMALAPDGNYYITNSLDGTLARITPSGALAPFVTSGLTAPTGIVVDAGGTLFVADSNPGTIVKVSPSGQLTPFVSGLVSPDYLAIDSQGSLFVIESSANRVSKVTASGARSVVLQGLARQPGALRYDASGNLFIAGGDGNLVRVAPGNATTTLASSLGSANAVAVAPNGDAFVTNFGAGTITRVSGTTATTFASGLKGPYGLAFDNGGTLYATENAFTGQRVVSFDAAGNKSVVAERLIGSARDVLQAANGDRYVLSSDAIGLFPAGGGAGRVIGLGSFNNPSAFAMTSDGGFVVQETFNVRRVTPSGVVTAIVPSQFSFFAATGVALDSSGNVLVANSGARTIVRVDASGVQTTIATLSTVPNVIVGDGAGGLYVGGLDGVITRVSASNAVTTITTAPVGPISRMALDAAGNKLYLVVSGAIKSFDLATNALAPVPANRNDITSIAFAGGQLLATDTKDELLTVSLSGVSTAVAAGFFNPSAITWDGSRLVFTSQSRTLSLVPGQYPQLVATSGVADVAANSTAIYGVSGSNVVRLRPGIDTTFVSLASAPGNGALSAIAVRADGALTVASGTDSRVQTFSASGQLLESHFAPNTPSGLAIDGSGNLYVSSLGTQEIIRIDPAGNQSLHVSAQIGAIALEASGTILGTLNGSVYRVDPATGATTTLNTTANRAASVLIAPAGTFVVDQGGAAIRKLNPDNSLPVFAAGLGDPFGLKFEPTTGGVLVSSPRNGSVVRVTNGIITPRALGMTSPQAITILPSGDTLAGGAQGHIYGLGTDQSASELTNLGAIVGTGVSIFKLATAPDGTLGATIRDRSELRFLSYRPAVPIAPPGATVFSATANYGGLGVDSVPVAVDFGSWVPPYGGDFTIAVQPVGSGVAGSAVNVLHVGPFATAQIAPAVPKVPPGTSAVALSVNVQGADFTTIAKADGANVTAAATGVLSSSAMGADADGNIYSVQVSGTTLTRSSTTGIRTTLLTAPTGQIFHMRGSIPVDDQQRLYVALSPSNNILRVNQDGTSAVFATLPEQVTSLVRGSGDVIFALGTTGIWRIPQQSSLMKKLELSPFSSPYGMSIDGQDNLYVMGSLNTITRITPSLQESSLVRPDASGVPGFEYEGVNIAGDCANSLFVTPFSWPALGQNFSEEHTLVQVSGVSGVPAQVLNGSNLNPALDDMDFIVFDRFRNNLLSWTDNSGGRIFRVPVACGAISTDLHLVFPAGQAVGGFTLAPKSTITRADGSVEYVWGFKDVSTLGRSFGLSTTLAGLTVGSVVPVASSAFLQFQNSFAPGDVILPVTVPTVAVDGMVDLAVTTDQSQYPANTNVVSDVRLVNRDATAPHTGTLLVEVTDAQGVRVAVVAQQAVTIPAGGTIDVAPPFNTAAYLTGSYLMKATLSDGASGVPVVSASTGFLIVADAVSVISSVATDKATYQAVDTANVTARAFNVSVNALASGLVLSVSVQDPSGQLIFSGSNAIPLLVPQANRDATFVVRLQSAPAGTYMVTEKLLDSTGATIDSHTATFAVLSSVDTGSGLSGAVNATRFANQGDTVSITLTARNQGNATLTNQAVTLSVVNAGTGALVTQFPLTITVPQGGQGQALQAWNTSGIAAGTYLVGATATFQGRTINLGQAPVTIGVIQPFAFAPATNVAVSTLVQSQPVSISGIVAPATVTITGGEFSVNGGAWSGSAGSVPPGGSISVRQTSSASFSTTTTATVTIAGFSAGFSVTTAPPDNNPNPFSFAPATNVPLSTLVASNTITVGGITTAVPISIVGGEYSVNGGAFTSSAGTVNNGDVVAVRVLSSASLGTTTSATLSIGNQSGTFTVTTTAVSTTPAPFTFTPQNNVPRSTLLASNQVTISGINVAVPISVTGGAYSIDGGAFTTAAGTISNGQKVAVQQTSSPDFSKTTTAILTVSTVTGSFAVTTEGADTSPDPFTFAAQTGIALGTPVTSNEVTIRGINTAVPISVAGGTYSVNAGAYTAASGTVNPLDRVTVRQTSSSSFATTTTATLTVSDQSAPFNVTTKSKADVTSTPSLSGDERVLVLVACKTSDDGDDDASCVQQRAPFLDTYLTGLGISHKITTTADAFKSELRSGRYDTFWVSGGAKKLEEVVASELVEAGFRGETLVLDGVHDSRNKVLDQVAGVLYKGKPSHLDTVTLTGSFLPSGGFAPAGSKPIRVDLTTGLGQAKFNTGDPAIATNRFGSGRGLLFAFDLVATLMADPSSTLLKAVTGASLDYVAPTVPAAFSGGAYVPFSFDLKNNEAVPITVDVVVTVPQDFTLVTTTPPATTSGNTATWHATLAAGATASFDGAVRVPETSGTYSLPIVVNQTYGSSSVQVGSYPIAIMVKGLDTTLPQTLSGLQALSVPSSHGEASSRDKAVSSLRSAQTAIGQARWEDALASLADAAGSLDNIASVDVSSYRVAVDNVMKEVEKRWWAVLPACPSASPCRNP